MAAGAVAVVPIRLVFEDPIFDVLKRVGASREKYIRETGKLPTRVLLGRSTYLSVRASLPVFRPGVVTLYGLSVVVIPLDDACAAIGDNDEEALR